MPNPPTKEFPLRHKFGMRFSLQEFETTPADFATIIPMFFADQAKTEALAQAVQVNPVADNYEDLVSTPACFMNSRVNMIKITQYAYVPVAQDMPDMLYHKAIITWGLGDHAIQDPAGTFLRTKLLFTKEADTMAPNYNGVKMLNGGFFHADVDGLTSTQEIEQVPLTPDALDAHRRGTLGAKIRKMVIGPFINRVHKDFPYYDSRWYSVPGATKRMNAFTGCYFYTGINATAAKAATVAVDRLTTHFDEDVTVDEESLSCHYVFEFNEYNDSFDIHA